MYGEELHFLGTVAEFASVFETYSRRSRYRGVIPGPYTPINTYTRLVPSDKNFPTDIAYAEFEFGSRFTKFKGEIYANSLPSRKTLVVMVFPQTNFESDYAKESLYWAWKGLKDYLEHYGWLEKKSGTPVHLQKPRLFELLTERCDEEEIRTFCFKLGLDYDDLRGDSKKSKARELIDYLSRRERLSELVILIRKERPDIPLDFSS